MKDVKINIYDLEKVSLNLRAQVNLIEVWNSYKEKLNEIKLMLKDIQESLVELENIIHDFDDID